MDPGAILFSLACFACAFLFSFDGSCSLGRYLFENYEADLAAMAKTFTIETPPKPGKILERPILYISRSTLPYEAEYEASELGIACLAWAVGCLRQYLDGSPFRVFTDHSAIPGILRSSASTSYSLKLDKFRMALMPFIDNMDIIHKPGKSIPHVDCLSRNVALRTDADSSDGRASGRITTWEVREEGAKVIEMASVEREE